MKTDNIFFDPSNRVDLDGNAFRGILVALALSLPFWAVAAFVVWAVWLR